MEDEIIKEVSKVFGIEEKDAIEFLNVMDTSVEKELPKDFFERLLEKIPDVKYFYIPEPPMKYNTSNMSESNKKYYENYYEEQYENYQKNLDYFQGRTTSKEDEVYLNEEDVMSGQFGTVMGNKDKSEYIYKKQYTRYGPGEKNFPSDVESILKEALINVILQTLPESKDHTCKIYKIFKEYIPGYNPQYSILFKLENLKGQTVRHALERRFPFLKESSDTEERERVYFTNILNNYYKEKGKNTSENEKEINKRLLIKIMAPLYKVIKTIREKYDFFHGDMHTDNLMFIEDPILEDGSFDESKLAVKMIDFGFSTIKLEDKRYGYYPGRFRFLHKEISIFLYLQTAGMFPKDLSEEVEKFMKYNSGEEFLQNVIAFEDYIIQQGNAMTGGRRKKQTKRRRQHKNKRRTKNRR